MVITPQLRALIAEKAAAERKPDPPDEGKAVFAAIRTARLDDGADPSTWLPSELARIGYCVIASSNSVGCRERAAEFAKTILEGNG